MQHGHVSDGAGVRAFARQSLAQCGRSALPLVTAAHRCPDESRRARPAVRRVPVEPCRQPREPRTGPRAADQRRAIVSARRRRSSRDASTNRSEWPATTRRCSARFSTCSTSRSSTPSGRSLFIAARGVSSAAVRLGIIGAYEAQAMQADLAPAHRHNHSRLRNAGAGRDCADRAADRPVPVDSRPSVFEVISIMSRTLFSSRRAPAYARRRSDRARIVQPARLAEAPRLQRPLVHRGHRRSGGQRQDRAPAVALPQAARSLPAGGRHERHLHEGGCRVPDAPRRAAFRAHPRRRNGRLPAHRHPRRHQPESRGPRRAHGIAPSRAAVRRERRRQPRRAVQPRSRRLHDLRHRRLGRRQDSAQRAARASRSRICSSSTRRISRRSSGRTSA